MEDNLPNSKVINIQNDNEIISFRHKNGMCLKVCFCQCYNCHKNGNEISDDKNNNKNNCPILKFKNYKSNTSSNNHSKRLVKEYSFDYNIINTDINPNIKEAIDKKLGLENKSDNTTENKLFEDNNKEVLPSNTGYGDLSQNISQYNDYNRYLLNQNNISDSKRFINTLHEIKNREKRLKRCASSKDFCKNNNKYLFNDYNTNYINNDKKGNELKNNINIVYDNNSFFQNSKKYDNNIKKMKKNLSMEYLNKHNYKLKDNKATTNKKQKNILSQNYVGNKLFEYNKNKRNNYFHNNRELNPKNLKNKIYSKKKMNDYGYNICPKNKKYIININNNYLNKEYIIDDNEDGSYNKYSKNESIQINNEIDNNLNPLGHIVDNFVSMLKNKYNNKNRIKNNVLNANENPISNIIDFDNNGIINDNQNCIDDNRNYNKNNNIPNNIISDNIHDNIDNNKNNDINININENLNNNIKPIPINTNKYNDKILEKKKFLNNIGHSKTKNNINNHKYKNYSSLENKIKNIEHQNQKNLIGQNNIKDIMQEYEKKYGKNSNFVNFTNMIKEKIANNNTNEIENPPGVYRNNKTYKFNKYNEDITKKYSTNDLKEKNKQKHFFPDINNRYYDEKSDDNINDNINNNINIELNGRNNRDNINISNTNNTNNSNIKILTDLNKDNIPASNDNYLTSPNDGRYENEKLDNLINNNNNKRKINSSISNNRNDNIQIHEFQIHDSKINNTEIKSLSNLSNYPSPNNINSKNDYMATKANEEKNQIISQPTNINSTKMTEKKETVSEKVKNLINNKAKINSNNLSLSSKLNIDTNLSLSDDNENINVNNNHIKRNIDISPKTIFTIYNNYENPLLLAFDIENKTFSFQEYSDFGNFEENYKLSLSINEKNNNSNKGNLFITIDNNLYIITGKNHDMLYMFDSLKKTMVKLCSLQNNHSNGSLLNYDNNIICLSGDYNKKVEMYSMKKNEWTNLPEMIIERSNSTSCIMNNKKNKYIFNIFGFNTQTKEYLNTIEYLIVNKEDSCWKYLNYNNPNLISLNIHNLFCVNYLDNKIVIIGGYNGKDNKNINKFMQIIFDKDNFENNIRVEETDRKLNGIDMNKKYLFCNGYKSYRDKNDTIYEVFDSEFNCHLFKENKIEHDVFYLHSK